MWFDTSWLMESQLIWMYNIFETGCKQVYHCTHFRPVRTSGSDLDPNDSVPERFFLEKVDFDKKKLADDKKIIKKNFPACKRSACYSTGLLFWLTRDHTVRNLRRTDKTLRSAGVSDMDLYCLPMPHKKTPFMNFGTHIDIANSK